MKNQLSISEKRNSHMLAVASFLALVLLAGLSIYQQRPPAAVSVDAPATDFSSSRALKHIAAIAKQTHPIGSPHHDEVREYILNELRTAGLTPEIQRTTSVNPRPFITEGFSLSPSTSASIRGQAGASTR